MDSTEADWDPDPRDRQWFSHRYTGDRGYLVRRAGKGMIRLDRPMEEILFKDVGDWVEDVEHRPMTVAQVAQIAFDADRRLCFYIGRHEQSKKEWANLRDKEKQFWMMKGPSETPRKELYAGIFSVLRPFFR